MRNKLYGGEMMKVGVLEKINCIESKEIASRLLAYLQTLGFEAVRFTCVDEIDGVDVVIVLGGDGAILHSAVTVARRGIKIVGVNYGNLGFLTEYEKDEWQALGALLQRFALSECRIVRRTLLQIDVGDKQYYALNEMALQRDYGFQSELPTQILKVQVDTSDGTDCISGDGILICTPTGSTAYSLSAGGAILTPEVPVLMLTPVCPFSMRRRPVVFSDEEHFSLTVERGNALLLIDGSAVEFLTENTNITVKKAPFSADFIAREENTFFDKVHNKLNQ